MTVKDRVKRAVILLAIGLAVNIALSIIKLYVGLSSNSLTIMLDATNSFFDIITCFITIIAFAALWRPANDKFPYGYGRSEYLAGFIVAIVSAVMGGLFFMRSLNRLAMPEPVYFGWQNCVLISVAVPLKVGLALIYYFQNKKLKSRALAALMLDSVLDTGITATSLVAFSISANVDYAVDGFCGIALSVVVIIFAVIMIIDNIKAVVVGDGYKYIDKARQIISDCADVVEIKQIAIHDYGYASKECVAKVAFKEGTSLERYAEVSAELSVRLFEEEQISLKLFPSVELPQKSEENADIFETSSQQSELSALNDAPAVSKNDDGE